MNTKSPQPLPDHSAGRQFGCVFAIGLVALGVALAAGCHGDSSARAEEYRSSVSPDGRFKMVVYRIPVTTTMMPGQSGDAPGFVRLYDQRSGHILEQKNVGMVQNIDQFEWSPTNLYIKLFADWRLPK